MDTEQDITNDTADFWSRAMALLIDWTLLFFFCLGLIVFAGKLFFLMALGDPEIFLIGLVVFLLLFPAVVFFMISLYFIVLHSWGGKTLGKIFMGIRVESSQGEGLPVGVSFLRLVGYLLSALPVGAGFLWSVLDKDHATWHDKLAGSRVVYD
ncbi:MAG: hypothetical protein GQ541_08865 [Desulfovibrionaceae bacterium]|jgi:uncharacterized RDD family membrane protein YckC|nr:hypothetical protein [Desulfovibrionaceae bacterium]